MRKKTLVVEQKASLLSRYSFWPLTLCETREIPTPSANRICSSGENPAIARDTPSVETLIGVRHRPQMKAMSSVCGVILQVL